MSIARPANLRRPLLNYLKKHFFIAVGLAAASGIAFKVFVSDPRMKKYNEFYK
jgi:hypothetical protein